MTPEIRKTLDELDVLVSQLPKGLHSDWKDTNHYELTSTEKGEFWWLLLWDTFHDPNEIVCETVWGKRLGLIMDVAEKLKLLEAQKEEFRAIRALHLTDERFWCAVEQNDEKDIGPIVGPGTWQECENQIRTWLKADNITLNERQEKTLQDVGFYQYDDGSTMMITPIVPVKEASNEVQS
jgi:hypothetical protein